MTNNLFKMTSTFNPKIVKHLLIYHPKNKLKNLRYGFTGRRHSGCILSVVICDDDFIIPLNRDFRGKDKPTDVLSFAQREGDFANKEDLLGDVIVSFETTCRQSVEHNQTTTQELELLLTHGILHLLGYDHIEDKDAVVMEERERIILESIRNQSKNDKSKGRQNLKVFPARK